MKKSQAGDWRPSYSAPSIAFGLCLAAALFSCHSKPDLTKGSGLVGKWEYEGCSIKNTAVNGYITFNADGRFSLDATARDDYPVSPIAGTYKYKVKGNRIETDYKNGYGLSSYFYIRDGYLYFSESPVDGEYWRYKLKRKGP